MIIALPNLREATRRPWKNLGFSEIYFYLEKSKSFHGILLKLGYFFFIFSLIIFSLILQAVIKNRNVMKLKIFILRTKFIVFFCIFLKLTFET